jgi:hypothetical protein
LKIHFTPKLEKGSVIGPAKPVGESKGVNYEYMRFEKLAASLKKHRDRQP